MQRSIQAHCNPRSCGCKEKRMTVDGKYEKELSRL